VEAALTAAANGRPVTGDVAALAAAGAADARRARGLDPRADQLCERRAALLEYGATLLQSAGSRRVTAADVRRFREEREALSREWTTWIESEGNEKYGLFLEPEKSAVPGT
jgi:hypothetical protein